MPNPLIAFDESGNTGQDLTNPDQPIFSLASVCISDSETENTLKALQTQQIQEVKFTSLVQSRSGQQRIISLFQSEHINPNTVKLSVIHKSCMIIGKVVDLLVEPLAHRDGIDLYERGANIAMTNLLYTTIPVVCGEENFQSFQKAFVRMIRNKDAISVREFYGICGIMYDSCKLPDFKPLIAIIIASADVVLEVLNAVGNTALDPAVTSFVAHLAYWTSQLDMEFDLVHDESKPLEQEKEMLSYLMSKDEGEIEVGYDRRKFILPFKASGIQFGDSKQIRQLQIADVIAGSGSYWCRGFTCEGVDKGFAQTLEQSGIRDLVITCIWPSDEVTPEELGTEEIGGISDVDYMAKLIARKEKGK